MSPHFKVIPVPPDKFKEITGNDGMPEYRAKRLGGTALPEETPHE